MATYFVSFSSTFGSLLGGLLKSSDLANGILVFGCSRKHVLLPYDQVPVEVLLANTVKPHDDPKCLIVNRKLIDHAILDMWDHFAAQIRKANLESRLLFMHEIGHPSYRTFCQEAVRRGDRVFWKSDWVKLDRPAASGPAEVKPAVSLPDDAFIEEVLSESAVGGRSIQDYSH